MTADIINGLTDPNVIVTTTGVLVISGRMVVSTIARQARNFHNLIESLPPAAKHTGDRRNLYVGGQPTEQKAATPASVENHTTKSA